MAKLYYRRIKEGRMTLEEVPARWRDAVAALLAEDEEEPEGD